MQKMEKVLKNFPTDPFTKGITNQGYFKAKENTNGTMDKLTKGIGGKENAMVQENGPP
jgi:hypothetical protein